MNKLFGALAATAVASLVATGAHANDAKKDTAYCQNNACKGHSACKGHGNDACKGQNSCKGHGFLDAKNKKDCEKDGKGKWMAKG